MHQEHLYSDVISKLQGFIKNAHILVSPISQGFIHIVVSLLSQGLIRNHTYSGVSTLKWLLYIFIKTASLYADSLSCECPSQSPVFSTAVIKFSTIVYKTYMDSSRLHQECPYSGVDLYIKNDHILISSPSYISSIHLQPPVFWCLRSMYGSPLYYYIKIDHS